MHSNAIWPQRAADLLPFAQRIRNRMRRRNGSRVRVKVADALVSPACPWLEPLGALT